MSTTRTDLHRPSAIVPNDYEYVSCRCKVFDFGDAIANQVERERLQAHMARTGGKFSTHEHGGSCHVCGSVNLIYGIIFYHEATNSYIEVGEDCANKLEFGGTHEFSIFRKAVREEMEIAKGKGKAQKVLAESNLSRAWAIYEAYKPVDFYANPKAHRDNQEAIIADIVGKLVKYGSISVNQGAFLGKLIAQIDNRAERAAARATENEAAAPFPATDARIQIEGEILSTKAQESDFGIVQKMLVRSTDGWKVWVTNPGGQKGDHVRFFAKVQVSRTDSKFGFGSRPTKFEVTQEAARPEAIEPAPRDEVNVPDIEVRQP
jgi:hypothetical protein